MINNILGRLFAVSAGLLAEDPAFCLCILHRGVPCGNPCDDGQRWSETLNIANPKWNTLDSGAAFLSTLVRLRSVTDDLVHDVYDEGHNSYFDALTIDITTIVFIAPQGRLRQTLRGQEVFGSLFNSRMKNKLLMAPVNINDLSSIY